MEDPSSMDANGDPLPRSRTAMDRDDVADAADGNPMPLLQRAREVRAEGLRLSLVQCCLSTQ